MGARQTQYPALSWAPTPGGSWGKVPHLLHSLPIRMPSLFLGPSGDSLR